MTRKHKPYPILENVEIEAIAAEGKCLLHYDDKVIFVPFLKIIVKRTAFFGELY